MQCYQIGRKPTNNGRNKITPQLELIFILCRHLLKRLSKKKGSTCPGPALGVSQDSRAQSAPRSSSNVIWTQLLIFDRLGSPRPHRTKPIQKFSKPTILFAMLVIKANSCKFDTETKLVKLKVELLSEHKNWASCQVRRSAEKKNKKLNRKRHYTVETNI
uniref:Uncharacterized protein n=1 Tax=Romanomermis culicivorax TaxID=13658 RepID=A0A915L177_ROMCU